MNLDIHSPCPSARTGALAASAASFIMNDCHLVAYSKAG